MGLTIGVSIPAMTQAAAAVSANLVTSVASVSTGSDTTAGSGGTSAAAGTSGTAGAGGTTTGAGAGASANVTTNTPKLQWAMQMGETIYVNIRASFGPSAWVAYTVKYLFADGNAVLVMEPDCVAYTGPLAVGVNLRRAGESYANS